MATQFDPDLKAYKQELNGLGKDSLKVANQNIFYGYPNTQLNQPLVSPQSVIDAVEYQQNLTSSVTPKVPTKSRSSASRWQNLRLTQKAPH